MVRLLVGLIKGLIVGALVGCALVAFGLGTPGPLFAYPAAAIAAIAVSLIAGKKIWEPDGRLQFTLKAIVGALIGPGLMWLARAFLPLPLPDVSRLPGAQELLPGFAQLHGQELTLGGFAVTSLALVAAVVGALYDLDNTPGDKPAPRPRQAQKRAARRVDPELAALTGLNEAEIDEASAEADERKATR